MISTIADYLMIARMANCDNFRLRRWRNVQSCAIAIRFAQGQDIRSEATDDLFGQCIIRRRQYAVQRSRNLGDPVMMKGMKDPGINASPVVDCHDTVLRT